MLQENFKIYRISSIFLSKNKNNISTNQIRGYEQIDIRITILE